MKPPMVELVTKPRTHNTRRMIAMVINMDLVFLCWWIEESEREGLSGGILNTRANRADIPAETADGAASRAHERCQSGCKCENDNVFE